MNLKSRRLHQGRHVGWIRLSQLVFCLLLLASSEPIPLPAATRFAPGHAKTPQYEPAACPFKGYTIPNDQRIECGYLVVPEDRDQPGGRTIRLAVAIIRARSAAPAPDPVVFLSGGPGFGALDSVAYFVTYPSAVRAHRDIILLDQRGTGYSQPNLQCREFSELTRDTQNRRLSLEESVALEVQAAGRCRDRLRGEGINLSAYTTAANAADVSDLRRALGYNEWNLWGLSYGTRLALTVMRDHPDGVRSVILDSALPPQAQWFEERAANTARAFQTLFAGCAAHAMCRARYPELERDFYALVDRLNAQPITITAPDPETGAPADLLVTGDTLVNGLFQALHRTDLVPYLPLAIDQVHAGNDGVISGLAGALRDDPSITHSGLWYSVECHDEAPFNDSTKIAASVERYPRLRNSVLGDSTLAVCAIWGVGPAGPIENQPVRSDLPSLVLAGQYDPIHPPAWSRAAAASLSHSFYYELPGSGHGVSFGGCGLELVSQWLIEPTRAPDSTCLASMHGPDFVTDVYLNRGIFKLATGLLQHPDPVQLSGAIVCLLVFVMVAIGWPVCLYLVWRGTRSPMPRPVYGAWWLAWLVAVLHIVFVIGLAWVVVQLRATDQNILLFGLPRQAAVLFIVPWTAAVLSIGLLVFSVLSWKQRAWSVSGRMLYLLMTLNAVGFLGLLSYWGLVTV